MTKDIIISLSGGKDSLAVTDICKRQFAGGRVEAFTMLWVMDLAYQQRYLEYIEQRFGITVYRVPIMDLSDFFDGQYFSWYRPSMPNLKKLTKNDIWDHCRRHFDIEWIATGERITDNFERGSRLRGRGKWDQKYKLYHPVADWTDTQVFNYLKLRHIPLPPRYTGKTTGYKAEMVSGEFFFCLNLNYPDDYQRILAVYPFLEAIRKRFELHDKRAGKILKHFNESHGIEGQSVEPPADLGTVQKQAEGEPETSGSAAAGRVQQADGPPR